MSSKPPENVPANESEAAIPVSDSRETDSDEAVAEETDSAEMDVPGVQSGDAEDEFLADDEGEFTLDHLSAAYANVLQMESHNQASEGPEPDLSKTNPEDGEEEWPQDREDAVDPEEADNAPCPISPDSIIEAILFVGTPKDVKLNSRKIATVLRDVSPKEVTEIVKKLNARYESEDAAYRIQNEKGALKMVLAPSLNQLQQDFFGRNKQVKLSQAAIDVMAVVAYNQPATREQVDKIRAKPSGSILSQLVKRKLLAIVPSEDFPDKKRRYSTTDKFLDFFNLDEISDLPQTHEVSDIDELAD